MLSGFAGGRVFGERHGEGPVSIVALHGWGRSRHDFAAVLDGIPSVALDLPGFGSSPPPTQPWGSGEYAEAVAPVLEELLAEGGQPAGADRTGLVLLGHSFGGCVAVQLASHHPELVAALVLTGTPRLVSVTPAKRSRPAPGYRLVRRLHRLGLVDEERMERARRRYGSTDYRAAEGVMRQVLVRVLAENLEPELCSLLCPVLMVWGAGDTAAPLASARRAAAQLPSASLEVIERAGHDVPREAPEALRAALLTSLAELAPPE